MVKRCFCGFCVILLAGCAHYKPQPISAEKALAEFDSRSLANHGLRAFFETNHVAPPSPKDSWDLNQLMLVAYYYLPSLAEARMQLVTAQAAKITAAQRPNPSVSVTPGYDSQIPGNFSPWLVPLTTDIPIETAGKRGKRISQAEHQSEAEHWNLVSTIWQVHSKIRSALLNLYSARNAQELLSQQEAAQSNVVRLLEGQFAAGAISGFEVTQARTALETTQLGRLDALAKVGQALVELGHSLGIPAVALSSANLSFSDFQKFPEDLTQPQVRRHALLNRSDIRAALADYEASQSTLQLEIANQYPDVHLGPGYTWNNGNVGDSQWSLGLTMTLPILNHNQGPIAEAEAKRKQAASHFITVQANAISEIEGALTGYLTALQQVTTAKSLLQTIQKRLESVRAMEQAGEVDRLAVATAQVEFNTAAQSRLDALVKAQTLLGQLEDAVQSPLTLSPERLRAAEQAGSQPEHDVTTDAAPTSHAKGL